MIVDIEKLKDIIEIEFGEIVEDVVLTDINELRIALIDGSFISDVVHEKTYGKPDSVRDIVCSDIVK